MRGTPEPCTGPGWGEGSACYFSCLLFYLFVIVVFRWKALMELFRVQINTLFIFFLIFLFEMVVFGWKALMELVRVHITTLLAKPELHQSFFSSYLFVFFNFNLIGLK